MNIKLTDEVKYIIDTFEQNGCEAYAVGGCVRDSFLGIEPKDWDICTPALPEQTMKFFERHHIIETGLKHGTITLRVNHKPFEITTYRSDGVYTDNRRPDKVYFVGSLKDDLSRRDFTVNAMAYNPKVGLVDFFGGVNDLRSRIIRCVGDADKRFHEDALRITRALRFAAVLGFTIEKNTSDAIFRNKNLLKNIAVERIAVELNKLLIGNEAFDILLKYKDVVAEFIPEITDTYADLNLWRDILTGVIFVPADVTLRLTMLLKHMGSDTAQVILKRLKYDRKTVESVKNLILYCDSEVYPSEQNIKRWLNKIGEQRFRQLLEVMRAGKKTNIVNINNIVNILNEIIESGQCFLLKDLAVSGRDLIDSGIILSEGAEIGAVLKRLLDMTIDGELENDKAKLLEAAVYITDFFVDHPDADASPLHGGEC